MLHAETISSSKIRWIFDSNVIAWISVDYVVLGSIWDTGQKVLREVIKNTLGIEALLGNKTIYRKPNLWRKE